MTVSIISPPPRNGGSSSSSSLRPQSTPMPVGPHILWPVKATRSAPSACTSTGMCGADCEASTHDQRADLVRPADELLGRVDGAEDVRDEHERDDLGALGDDLVEVGEVEPAVVGEAEPAQRRAGALR